MTIENGIQVLTVLRNEHPGVPLIAYSNGDLMGEENTGYVGIVSSVSFDAYFVDDHYNGVFFKSDYIDAKAELLETILTPSAFDVIPDEEIDTAFDKLAWKEAIFLCVSDL